MTLRTNSTHVLHAARPAALIGVLVLLWGISFAPSVLALPPGGAATVDTPGTSSSVSPGSVEQCGSINFEVNGFPAGETVNVKIDDGSVSGGDASVQGHPAPLISTAISPQVLTGCGSWPRADHGMKDTPTAVLTLR